MLHRSSALRLRARIPARRQNHLLGRSREVGGAGSMARALVMLDTSTLGTQTATAPTSATPSTQIRSSDTLRIDVHDKATVEDVTATRTQTNTQIATATRTNTNCELQSCDRYQVLPSPSPAS
jgi:hypothetical protein